MSTIPSKDQQIEALWKACMGGKNVVDINTIGKPTINLLPLDSGQVDLARPSASSVGNTREEAIAKLIAYQAAGRLDGTNT